MRHYHERHPRAFRALAKHMLGEDVPESDRVRSVAKALPVVALTA